MTDSVNGQGALQEGTLVDSRDGHTYKTVKIADQWWMAENLAYLPSVSPSYDQDVFQPRYFVNGYDGTDVNEAKATANYQTYGVLYNWPTAMTGANPSDSVPSGVQGVCPAGWHLPSDAEWQKLADYVDAQKGPFEFISNTYKGMGKYLKATYGWDTNDGTDDFGFTALPGGSLDSGDFYPPIGNWAGWYSSSLFYFPDNTNQSLIWFLVGEFDFFSRGTSLYNNAYSVRCVKDE